MNKQNECVKTLIYTPILCYVGVYVRALQVVCLPGIRCNEEVAGLSEGPLICITLNANRTYTYVHVLIHDP